MRGFSASTSSCRIEAGSADTQPSTRHMTAHTLQAGGRPFGAGGPPIFTVRVQERIACAHLTDSEAAPRKPRAGRLSRAEMDALWDSRVVVARLAPRFRARADALGEVAHSGPLRRAQISFGAMWAGEGAFMVALGVVAF